MRKSEKRQAKRPRTNNTGSSTVRRAVPSTAPWPRADRTPFTGPHVDRTPEQTTWKWVRDSFRRRQQGQPWGQREDIVYNGWLRVSIKPTRLMCAETLASLGLLEYVTTMLGQLGMGTFLTRRYPLYPELVIQFYASCPLDVLTAMRNNGATDASMSFMCRGLEYTISIPDLCDLYGFDKTKTELKMTYDGHKSFWDIIGSGDAEDPRYYRVARILNPVLRIVAKMLANVLFEKRLAELQRLEDVQRLLLRRQVTTMVVQVMILRILTLSLLILRLTSYEMMDH